MGKPYKTEMAQFNEVINWSKNQNVEDLKSFFREIDFPVYCIGSGGSLTIAALTAQILENIGITSKYVTAFDFLSMPESINKTSYILFSASGNNNDALAVVKKLLSFSHNKKSLILTQNPGNKIEKYSNYNVKHISYNIPSEKDGFLATNSLLATCIIICKLFKEIGLYEINLEEINFEDIIYNMNIFENKKYVLAIYGKWGLPAAVDLESKLFESGIISVQLADYRNFAHGRHNWIDKNFNETLVVFIETNEDKELRKEILNFLPNNLNYIKLSEFNNTPINAINLILKVMNIVYYLGLSKGIDPGQPNVPEYGSKIYNIDVSNFYATPTNNLTRKELAILRKSKYKHFNLIPKNIKKELTKSYENFYKKLTSTKFKAIIFDYDATLLSRYSRFENIDLNIRKLLEKILDKGIKLAIVTGRGKSIHNDISNSLLKKFHEQIYIGYYNGAIIKKLSEGVPNKNLLRNKNVENLNKLLKKNMLLNEIANIDSNSIQISIILTDIKYENYLISILKEIMFKNNIKNLKILKSSHSIDIIPKNVSKTCMYDFLNEKYKLKNKILCVGDSGQWPGNDFELLSSSNSLSVDSVSSLYETCWNMEFEYEDTIDITKKYLENLKVENNYFIFKKNKDYE